MTTTRLLVLAAIAAGLLALYLAVRPHRAPLLPRLTPGVASTEVTQANIRDTVCHRGWTKTIRPPVAYTNALKLKQMRRYGLRRGLKASCPALYPCGFSRAAQYL